MRRGVDLGKEFRRSAPPTEEERKVLFGQTAYTAARHASASPLGDGDTESRR